MEIFTKEIIAHSQKKAENEPCSAGDVFRMLETIAGQHSAALGFSREKLLQKDAVWIVASQKAEFSTMPRRGQKLRISTWPGKTRFALFSRHYRIEDENGKLLVQAAANWTLLHLKNRSIVSPKKAGIEAEAVVTGTEISVPKHIAVAADDAPSFERIVCPEEIDANGHMNNAVYPDWIEEYLQNQRKAICGQPSSAVSVQPQQLTQPVSLTQRTAFSSSDNAAGSAPALRSIAIQYKHELLLGDCANIRTEQKDDRILLMGECGGKIAFCAEAQIR